MASLKSPNSESVFAQAKPACVADRVDPSDCSVPARDSGVEEAQQECARRRSALASELVRLKRVEKTLDRDIRIVDGITAGTGLVRDLVEIPTIRGVTAAYGPAAGVAAHLGFKIVAGTGEAVGAVLSSDQSLKVASREVLESVSREATEALSGLAGATVGTVAARSLVLRSGPSQAALVVQGAVIGECLAREGVPLLKKMHQGEAVTAEELRKTAGHLGIAGISGLIGSRLASFPPLLSRMLGSASGVALSTLQCFVDEGTVVVEKVEKKLSSIALRIGLGSFSSKIRSNSNQQ